MIVCCKRPTALRNCSVSAQFIAGLKLLREQPFYRSVFEFQHTQIDLHLQQLLQGAHVTWTVKRRTENDRKETGERRERWSRKTYKQSNDNNDHETGGCNTQFPPIHFFETPQRASIRFAPHFKFSASRSSAFIKSRKIVGIHLFLLKNWNEKRKLPDWISYNVIILATALHPTQHKLVN